MALPKLNVATPQEGYSFDEGEAVLRAKVSSGPSRTRLDMLDATLSGTVSLVLDPEEYGYWRAFYRTIIGRGSMPFLMDLVIDGPDVAEYQVQIVPGTVKTNVQGSAHIVQMELEVVVPDAPTSADYDAAIVMLYGFYGPQGGLVLNRLQRLVNFDFPGV